VDLQQAWESNSKICLSPKHSYTRHIMDKRSTSPFFEKRKVKRCIHIQSARNCSPVKEITYEVYERLCVKKNLLWNLM